MSAKMTFLKRVAILTLVSITLFQASSPLIKTSPARASDWAGWDAINTIYYDPSQDEPINEFLEQAALELSEHLSRVGEDLTVVTDSRPDSGSIYLEVDATHPDLADKTVEAFKLYADSDGVYITGKTAIAVREGAYTLLDILGFRWFFKSDIFDIVPDSLASLSGLDETDEPDYVYRFVEPDAVGYNIPDYTTWAKRNRTIGAASYRIGHAYATIYPQSNYSSDPASFTGDFNPCWQLYPYSPNVIAAAKSFANGRLASIDSEFSFFPDDLPRKAVSIAPNDGWGWDPPWTNDSAGAANITEAVYSLANEVARYVAGPYPDALVGVYSYSWYSMVPTIDLEPNILAMVATDYNYSDQNIGQRIIGLVEKGVQVGIRDYVDIWSWSSGHDRPSASMSAPSKVKAYNAMGAKYYNGEAADNWGGKGLIYYVLSKVLWDCSLDIEDILDDFYTKSFGAAASTMREYYETRDCAAADLAESFRLLDQAETEAAADEGSLSRIRFLECYNYFLWKYHNVGIDNLSLEDLKEFYTFLTRTRNWYIISYIPVESEVRDELASRGLSSESIAALQNFTAPTSQDVAGWMNEALAEWGDEPGPIPDYTINPRAMDLTALGDSAAVAASVKRGATQTLLIPSQGMENVTIAYKGNFGGLQWYDPNGVLIDYYSWSNVAADWATVSFATYLPGNYLLHAVNIYQGQESDCYIDVPDRPAAYLASPGRSVFSPDDGGNLTNEATIHRADCTEYFYVPAGTASFTYNVRMSGDVSVSATLTDPEGNIYNYQNTTSTAQELVDSPIPGLWSISVDRDGTAYECFFSLVGIPPLIWHDPEYLLVPASGYTPPDPINHAPALSHIGAKSVKEGHSLEFTVSATDPDGDPLTYAASNLPTGATFNTSSGLFSWTPGSGQAGTYGGVRFSASDGSLTDYEYITITVEDASSNPTLPGKDGGTGGGPGGGGGGNTGVTRLSDVITDTGRMVVDVAAEDADQKVKLVIPKDTVVRNSSRQAVSSIIIKPFTDSLAPLENAVPVSSSYNIQPGGTTFSPSATLVFKYQDAAVPAGISENSLFVALWDMAGNQWLDLGGTVDAGANTVSLEVEHLSIYALMAHTRPAGFELSDAAVAPGEIHPGEQVTFSAIICNTGDLAGTCQVSLELDGTVVETRAVDLTGQESRTLQFTAISETAGEHVASIGDLSVAFTVIKPLAPAEFLTSNLAVSPSEVAFGNRVDVFVLVMNAGDLSGTYKISLKSDGEEVLSRDIQLDGGKSELVDFSIEAGSPGQHTVSINGLTAVYTALVPVSIVETHQTTVAISDLAVDPVYSRETGKLVSARVGYRLTGPLEQLAGGGLSLKVHLDGRLLEEVPLRWLNQPQADGIAYTPALGWEPGSYTFLAELRTAAGETRIAGPAQLTVAPGSVARVVSWKFLGIIIGAMLVAAAVLVGVVVYRRRDMLGWRY